MTIDVSKTNFWALTGPQPDTLSVVKSNFWALTGPELDSLVVVKSNFWLLVSPTGMIPVDPSGAIPKRAAQIIG